MINKLIKSKNNQIKPKWFLRQSGRHIPEYFSIRNKHEDFIDFCLNKSSIVKATVLPLKYYNIDAAILFSDILLLPYFLGQKVTFKKNIGPVLKKINIDETLLKGEEKEILEDLIIAAINDVKEKGEAATQEQMKSLTGGLPLPPGMKLPF